MKNIPVDKLFVEVRFAFIPPKKLIETVRKEGKTPWKILLLPEKTIIARIDIKKSN